MSPPALRPAPRRAPRPELRPIEAPFVVPGPSGVEHRDQLARFGVEYIEAVLSAQGRTVRVVDDGEVDNGELEDDLVRDMTDVLAWFCARLYGRRAARDRAEKALAAAAEAAE